MCYKVISDGVYERTLQNFGDFSEQIKKIEEK